VTIFLHGDGQFGENIGPDVVSPWDVFDADLFEGGLNDCSDQMVML